MRSSLELILIFLLTCGLGRSSNLDGCEACERQAHG